MGHAVRARGVDVRRGANLALSGVDLDLPTGSFVAVVGPNGSGKSTFLRAVSGLEPCSAGTLEVLGRPAGEAELAHVLQSTVVNESVPITVRDVVSMGLFGATGLLGRLRPHRQRVEDAMRRTDVTDLAGRRLHELSGGQRQRVLLAQALVADAPLLLLDEPASGLDRPSAVRIDHVIEEEVAAGRTVVLATHDLHTAQHADVVVLVATRVVAAGPPEEVLTPEHLSAAFGGHLHALPGGGHALDDPDPHG